MNALLSLTTATTSFRRLLARPRAPVAPGWRGGVALVLDAVVAATLAGVILALSAVAVAAHAADAQPQASTPTASGELSSLELRARYAGFVC